jgi:hypothetical protein
METLKFLVNESHFMRKSFPDAEKYRTQIPGFPTTKEGDNYGFFIMVQPTIQVRCMVSPGEESGWDHVSVSVKWQNPNGKIEDKLPPWEMMQLVKRLFWEDEDCVIQFHPPESEYVNRAQVLHLWKKVGPNWETPPKILIG